MKCKTLFPQKNQPITSLPDEYCNEQYQTSLDMRLPGVADIWHIVSKYFSCYSRPSSKQNTFLH